MTAHDYIILAEQVGRAFALTHKRSGGEARDGLYEDLYVPLCDALLADNPDFDQHRFCYAVAVAEDQAAMSEGRLCDPIYTADRNEAVEAYRRDGSDSRVIFKP